MRSDKCALGMSALVLGGLVVCSPAGSSASDSRTVRSSMPGDTPAADCEPSEVCTSGEEVCDLLHFPLNPGPPGNACGTSGYTAKIIMTFSQEAGGQRTFFVYRPAGFSGQRPVVIVYHGGDNHCTAACMMMTNTRMKHVADEQGFIMIFPLGQHALPNPNPPPDSDGCHGWGWRYSEYQEWQPIVSDVQFTRELIAFALANYCIDPARIYATGLSQGGFLSYRLACQLSDWIAAVAPVAAGDVISFNTRQTTMAAACQPPQQLTLFDDCHPLRPVPVLHAHGTADGAVCYYGGSYFPGGGCGGCDTWPGAFNSTSWWINHHNGCDPQAGNVVSGCAVNDPNCPVNFSCMAYVDACVNGAEVQLCTVFGGDHFWPGGINDPNGDLDASNYMVEDFFERFDRDPSLVNVTWNWKPNVSAVLNRLAKSGTNAAFDAAAASKEKLQSGNGALELMASETSTNRIIGLNSGPDRDLDPSTIEFAFGLGANASLGVYDGTWHSVPSYYPGDLLRIEIAPGPPSNQVRFFRNGSLIYSNVSVPLNYPFNVRAALYTPQATLDGVVLSGTVAP